MIATVDVIDDVHASHEEGIIADWAARIAQGVESSVCRFCERADDSWLRCVSLEGPGEFSWQKLYAGHEIE